MTMKNFKINYYKEKRGYLFAIVFILFSATLSLLFFANFSASENLFSSLGRDRMTPLIFILICTIKPFMFFIPSMGLTVIAGLMFGPFYGTLYVALGGGGSSIVAFYLARGFGRQFVERLIKDKKKLLELDDKIETEGFKTILLLRLLNLPWDLVSYSAGLSKMRFKDFYLASLLLLLPISFIYTYFGSSLRNPLSISFLISLTVIIMLSVVTYMSNRNKNARKK